MLAWACRVSGRGGAGASGVRALSAASRLAQVPMGPPDPILGLTDAFKKDSFANKVNVGVGAYRDDEGKPVVLECVKEAERRLLSRGMDHEYGAITGDAGFVKEALAFAYGAESRALAEKRVAGSQSLSGTGALRVLFAFVARYWGAGTKLYLPSPTWSNHFNIARDCGLSPATYRYVPVGGVSLDFAGMKADLEAASPGSVVLLHACAHNPTGVDPSAEQWAELSALCRAKGHQVLFDSAYQGFASGDPEKDVQSVRRFVADGHSVMLAQSFAKNFGLYGERVGACSIVCKSEEEAERVLSQLKIIIRPMYSNPPLYGARVVREVLADPALRSQWAAECKAMADRIGRMRLQLQRALADAGSTSDWSHVVSQIGMFCYSGLSPAQVQVMIDKHHIYMTKDGRISIAGLNSSNVKYVAEAIHDVTK